jgi:hypothetical protein
VYKPILNEKYKSIHWYITWSIIIQQMELYVQYVYSTNKYLHIEESMSNQARKTHEQEDSEY